MPKTKAVGVRELKNKLSGYLREVKSGTRILVTEHSEVVAELRSPHAESVAAHLNPQYAEWVEKGWIHPPLLKKRPLPAVKIRLKETTSAELLRQDREER